MIFRILLWNYLLFAPRLLLVWVLFVLYQRRLFKRYPFFSAYLAYELIQFPFHLYTIFSKSVTDSQFWFSYSLFLAGSVFLRFGVIYELFSNLSKSYPSLRGFSRLLFRALVVFFLLLAVSLAAFSWPGNATIRNHFVTYVLDRGVNLLQLGLLLGLFGIAKFFGLSWRKHVFGITLGFALYLSVQLLVTAVQAEWGYFKIIDYFTMAAYHCSVLIWLIYVRWPEPVPVLTSIPEHADMHAWNEELSKLLRSK